MLSLATHRLESCRQIWSDAEQATRRALGAALFCLLSIVTPLANWAQDNSGATVGTEPDVGIRSQPPTSIALTNAVIVMSSDRELANGSLLIEQGRITAVGETIDIPAGTEVIDCQGDYLYPAFIDAFVEFESSASETELDHWNGQITPQLRMDTRAELSGEKLKSLREAGIAVALAAPNGGIIKGQSCVVLTSEGEARELVLRDRAFQHMRFYPDRRAGGYPNSPMGAVALVRQVLSDANWYQAAWKAVDAQPSLPAPVFDASLAALADVVGAQQTVMIDAPNELYALRADRMARDYSLKLVVRGSGREYRRLDAMVDTGRVFTVPVDFPKPPKVSTQAEVADATLQELMHWRLAPDNPARMYEAGIDFVLTSDGLDEPKEFLTQLRKAVARGLSEAAALDAVTLKPARLLQIEAVAGSLTRGKLANILRTNGPLFDEGTQLKETWVQGQVSTWIEEESRDLRGDWSLKLEGLSLLAMDLKIDGKPEKLSAKFLPLDGEPDDTPESEEDAEDGEDADGKDKSQGAKLSDLKVTDYGLSGTFNVEDLGIDDADSEATLAGTAFLDAAILDADGATTLNGSIVWPDGTRSPFAASPKPAVDETPEDAKEDAAGEPVNADDEGVDEGDLKSEPEDTEQDTPKAASTKLEVAVNYPLGAYGVTTNPVKAEATLFRGATIWTCAEAGILENADLLIQDGLVAAVGTDLEVPAGTTIVDATGMHISPGIIDCHSHMATDGGVNESGQAITAEVRIGDFIDPNDITIYRQLAGGVTSSNILHGSANPIGGQNQVIKLRWGQLGEAMKMAEAPEGIKFALGENVKQSRSDSSTRYPQTRMGVEQIMRDRFEAAKLYRAAWQQWNADPAGLPPRKDFELEAIAEILEGTRWVHCHSYRQDEILAMLRTLEDYGVTIGSLQHILEGYKVADVMAAHGAMASSFSDWWAYKFEVYDAIPHNGAIMHRAGIVVSFNSDDGELARHLNHEAAKAVKYGGVPEEEALKFVTLNPAKQLRIDRWVGSLEVGKHADLVLWNKSPLSTMSACMQTWVDGCKYFDRDEDLERRKVDADLRRKLIQLVLAGDEESSEGEDDDPSYWWARHDEFCHHSHDDDDYLHAHEDQESKEHEHE